MTTTVFIAIWELSLPEGGHRDPNLLVLGRAVRRMREQQGMSADELAGATGTSRHRIDALETGHLDPTYELLLALAEGLDTQPSTLVTLAERLKESNEP
ncbi:MAG TPA: helix-turn-helix transcriptional regulator [Solirubrobacteraceae bacterium]